MVLRAPRAPRWAAHDHLPLGPSGSSGRLCGQTGCWPLLVDC
ncbi:hypothetical protein ACFPRL_25810 [Pseudoclavibacter helvolus]